MVKTRAQFKKEIKEGYICPKDIGSKSFSINECLADMIRSFFRYKKFEDKIAAGFLSVSVTPEVGLFHSSTNGHKDLTLYYLSNSMKNDNSFRETVFETINLGYLSIVKIVLTDKTTINFILNCAVIRCELMVIDYLYNNNFVTRADLEDRLTWPYISIDCRKKLTDLIN